MKLVYLTTASLALGFFRGQLEYMQSKGFEVVVVSSPGSEQDEIYDKGFQVHPISMKRRISPLDDLISLAKICWLFVRLHPTIVVGSTPKAAMLSMCAAALARVPVKFYSVFGVMIEMGSGWTRQILWLVEWMTCLFADRIISVSRSAAEIMIRAKLCPANKITVLLEGSNNGVDAEDRFNPSKVDQEMVQAIKLPLGISNSGSVVGYVGRLVRDKGIVDLARAWDEVRQSNRSAYLILVGELEADDPVPRPILERLMKDPSVIITGAVTRAEMPLYYSLMDLVVLPTYREGFPNVPLEAAAMELPVVGTTVTGCVDAIMHGRTGTLVPPHDHVALSQVIQIYLNDEGLRRRHGLAGREWVLREFRPERVWEAMYQEYLQALRNKGTSPVAPD